MKDNWSVVSLDDLAEFRRGSFPQPYGLDKWYDDNFGKPFIQVYDVGDNLKLKTATKRKISKLAERMSVFVPKGSLILTIQGSIGRTAITDYDAYMDRTLLVFQKFNVEVDLIFIQYVIKELFEKAKVNANGSTIKTITKEELREFTINLPPLPQQRKIAKILSTCDTVIAKTEEAIAKYQAIKQGMMHDLFTRGIDLSTGKLRPKYQDAPELYKESELGMIPKDWEVKRLEECVEIKVSNVDKKIHPNKKLVRLCNYMDSYNNDFITNDLDFMTGSADLNEISRFSLYPQDVIITKDSETPDDIAVPSVVIEELENVVCGYHLAILKPIQEVVNGEFLMYNLKVPSVQKYFFRIASGSTRYGLTIGGIQNAKFSIPKGKEQLEIKNKLLTLDSKIEAEKETLSKYQQIKFGLMQDLLSGKVEVSVSKEEEIA